MQLVVNIVVLGSIYALIGCGYVLIYRVSRVLSLAHGELMMLGAYGLMTVAGLAIGQPLLSFAIAGALSLATGALVYAVLMRRMTGEAVLASVLATIALGILLRGAIALVWSAQLVHPAAAMGLANPVIALPGGARISTVSLCLVGFNATVYLTLAWLLSRSRLGLAMRAAGQNPRLAAQRGINLHAVYAFAWGLAVFTGGVTGMLVACDAGLDATMATIGLKAFPAALVGGLDSFVGALAGAAIVAAAEVLLIHHVDPLLSDVVPFLVLTVMLLVRPWGLFGSREELERV